MGNELSPQMASFRLEAWLAVAALLVLGASLLRAGRDRRHLESLRREAQAAISAVRVESSDARFALDGAVATVEHREESGGVRGLFQRRAALSVTVHVRDAAGARFLIKWHSLSDRKPYVQHLGR